MNICKIIRLKIKCISFKVYFIKLKYDELINYIYTSKIKKTTNFLNL